MYSGVPLVVFLQCPDDLLNWPPDICVNCDLEVLSISSFLLRGHFEPKNWNALFNYVPFRKSLFR